MILIPHLSPDEKTSDDDRTLYPTDEHEDIEDNQGRGASSTSSQRNGSNRNTPGL